MLRHNNSSEAVLDSVGYDAHRHVRKAGVLKAPLNRKHGASSPKPERVTDAVAIIDHYFYEGKPERLASLQHAEVRVAIAESLYSLRASTGLSQEDFAKRVGFSVDVIDDLEEADYKEQSPVEVFDQIRVALLSGGPNQTPKK